MEAEAVLYIDNPINESADRRNFGSGKTMGPVQGPGGIPGAYDWRVWSGVGFGQTISRGLNSIGTGFSCEVTDMGAAVSVRASYHSPATGKSVSKTYIILFNDPRKGDGQIFITSSKWRSISTADQAISYISSSIKSYATSANNV